MALGFDHTSLVTGSVTQAHISVTIDKITIIIINDAVFSLTTRHFFIFPPENYIFENVKLIFEIMETVA